MAAEKLTKARLVQIIITFFVLVSVFTWKTLKHTNYANPSIICHIGSSCQIKNMQTQYSILFEHQIPEQLLKITLQHDQNSESAQQTNNQPQVIWIDSNSLGLKKTKLNKNSDVRVVITKWVTPIQLTIQDKDQSRIKINLVK